MVENNGPVFPKHLPTKNGRSTYGMEKKYVSDSNLWIGITSALSCFNSYPISNKTNWIKKKNRP